jgi:hypothetical protein
MSRSPDEEIAGQVLGGCGMALLVAVLCLAGIVGLIAFIVHLVK